MTNSDTTARAYNLSAEELQRWKSSLEPLAKTRGTKTRLAKALYHAKVAELSSCKNMVSEFFHGKPDTLRTIFDDPKRLQIIAEGLSMTPDTLGEYLAAARTKGKDLPFSQRIPGFEDLGPFDIVDAAFSPPAGQKIIITNCQVTAVSDGLSSWSFDDLFELATSDDQSLPTTIFIVGSNDAARITCLRWLQAKLREVGLRISDWRRTDLEDGGVLVQSEFDRLTPRDQLRLLKVAANTQAVLFATASTRVPAEDQCTDRVVLLLGSGSVDWALRYLNHLEQLLNRHGHAADLEPVRRWLEDDPRSGWAIDDADALGLVARDTFDSRALPFSNKLLLERWLHHAAQRLRIRGRAGEAAMLEVCGQRALAGIAASACRSHETWIAIETVARTFVEAADGIAGESIWRELGAAGMLSLVDGLIEMGLLRRRGSRVTFPRMHLLVSALGFYIAENLEDHEIIRVAVLHEQWHPSLLAAAEVCGDPSPIIAAINRQSAGVRCASAPAMAWVLGSGARPSDRPVFARAFLLALRWWAMRPQKPLPRTLTLGSARAPVPASPNPVRIGGREPLVALAQISLLHHTDLPRGWTSADLRELELDDAMVRLESLEFDARLDEQTARLALMIGAPFQSLEILAADLWACMPQVGDAQTEMDARLCREDYTLWWRTVAAPRLLLEADGKARIAGVHSSHSIRCAMQQNLRGTKIWVAALCDGMLHGMDGAADVFIDAVQCYTSVGGRWNQDGLDSIWQRLSESMRAELRLRVAARLCEAEPWLHDEDGTTWLMTTFLNGPDLVRLWEDWSTRGEMVALYFPWRSFLAAGVDADRILGWALATISDQQTYAIEPTHEMAQGWTVAQLHQSPETPQAAALAHLVDVGDIRLLARLHVFAPSDIADHARRRLAACPQHEVREALLEMCDDLSTPHEIRSRILARLHPRPGEAERWSHFAEMSPNPFDRLAHKCQVDCARAEDHGRWRAVSETLELLESLIDDPRRHLELMQQVVSEGLDAQQLAAVVDGLCSNLLTGIGVLLARTTSGLDERGPVVEHVFATPSLRKKILGGVHAPWWGLALELHGEERTLAWLRAGDVDSPNATQARLGAIEISEAMAWAAVEDGELGSSIAQRFAARRPSLNIEIAAANLSRLGARLRLDGVHELARLYVIAGGDAAARAFQAAMLESGAESEETERFWMGVARGLTELVALAAVMDELSE
ncbi:hypothetical protein [Enhygromyxa salina]|uniref:Uncharacterized protein n=1 Tax=Enhygromyxa salina TaxID=215803 RepID=A0A2S9YJ70_9BACT|nr:hypothetical protein [Enhygromyxa salina]PRQ05144.1 hypothetical protein ENSA7_47730 [Enhygromyxa salina]